MPELDSFVRDEYAAVVAAVRLITGDRDGAADSVQDAIVRYLEQPPVEPVRNVAAWVTIVASNRSRDRFRRQQAERRAVERMPRPDSHAAADSHVSDPQVLAAVRSLPLGQRQACILFYFLDLSVAEIADELDVSTGTVKTQLFRARKTLAESLVHERAERPTGELVERRTEPVGVTPLTRRQQQPARRQPP